MPISACSTAQGPLGQFTWCGASLPMCGYFYVHRQRGSHTPLLLQWGYAAESARRLFQMTHPLSAAWRSCGGRRVRVAPRAARVRALGSAWPSAPATCGCCTQRSARRSQTPPAPPMRCSLQARPLSVQLSRRTNTLEQGVQNERTRNYKLR